MQARLGDAEGRRGTLRSNLLNPYDAAGERDMLQINKTQAFL